MTEQLSIFISYSRKDSAFVDRLEADLVARNFAPWVDRRQLDPGSGWMREIENAIAKAQVVVVVLSPAAVESQYVEAETISAFNQKKHIFPLLVRPVERVPLVLNTKHWTDFVANSYATALTDFVNALVQIEPVQQLQRKPTAQVASTEVGPLDLVTPHPAPKPPDPELRDLFSAGLSAKSKGDFDRTVLIWEQILQRDANFQNGIVQREIRPILHTLRPIRIQRLTERANTAAFKGAWGEEIGSWEALLLLDPQNHYAEQRKQIALQNQHFAWIYEDAGALLGAGDRAGAREQLSLLYRQAPDFGDPMGHAGRLQLGQRLDRGTRDRTTAEHKKRLQEELSRLQGERAQLVKRLEEPQREIKKLDNFPEYYKLNKRNYEESVVMVIGVIATYILGLLFFWRSGVWADLGTYWLSDLFGNVIRFILFVIIGLTAGIAIGLGVAQLWHLYRLRSAKQKISIIQEWMQPDRKRLEEIDKYIDKLKEPQ